MVSQLTVYAKILCLLMTLFSAGASTRDDNYLLSECNSKYLRAKNGSVFAVDNFQNGPPQNFTVVASRISRELRAFVTIYSKETNTYICFDKNWRIKTMRPKANMSKRCMFYEMVDVGGGYRYQSVVNQHRSLGFQKNGKPIGGPRNGARAGGGGGEGGGGGGGRKRPIDRKCYSFQRINASSTHLQYQQPQQQQQQTQQRPEVKIPRMQNQQLQPRQRHQHQHRQQQLQQQQQQQLDSRKDTSGGESNGNTLLSTSYSATSASLPNRHRHKHGTGRGGKSHPALSSSSSFSSSSSPSSVLQNLDTGASGATMSSYYGTDQSGGVGVNQPAYGKGGGHRRSNHLNSHTSTYGEPPSMLLPALPAIAPAKLPPPRATIHTSHPGAPPLDAGGPFRKEPRRQAALDAPRDGGAHRIGGGANGKKKASTNGAVPKLSAPRGRDKRALG